jgi:hypothetical protein
MLNGQAEQLKELLSENRVRNNSGVYNHRALAVLATLAKAQHKLVLVLPYLEVIAITSLNPRQAKPRFEAAE